jgi:hypothetical protein
MPDDRDEIIRRRAYALWEAEGRPEGREREHWQQAESESGGFAEAQAGFGGPEVPGPEGQPDEIVPDTPLEAPGEDAPQPSDPTPVDPEPDVPSPELPGNTDRPSTLHTGP